MSTPLRENDICEYKGKTVRLLFAAAPLPGWIAVRIQGGGGGYRRTYGRVHVDDESKLHKVEVKVRLPRKT